MTREIEAAYAQLGHRLGWRFLASPADTLSATTQLAFVGLNPAGGSFEPPKASVEEGNAYRLESWSRTGGPNPLQIQVCLFYDALAAEMGLASPSLLMDETLAANFCPFRSPSWDKLVNRPGSIEFSKRLWTSVIEVAQPAAMVCLGSVVAQHLGASLEARGARRVGVPHVRMTGWGDITYDLATYESVSGRTLLVRLPHLSRFRIFGRRESRSAIAELTSAVAAAMARE